MDRLLEPLPYPVALWVRGTLPPAGPAVAMVGSRQGGPAGPGADPELGPDLTAAGVAVLSGLARGVDGAAHRGALEAGATWGIMGSGLDHPYPPEHVGLMDRMVAAGGGVVTPFPPAARPLPWHFPRRNLILAAWTRGVALMAARYASGSLVTAKLALDLGKEVWACPGAPGGPPGGGTQPPDPGGSGEDMSLRTRSPGRYEVFTLGLDKRPMKDPIIPGWSVP